jgi:hypothetical protein
MITKQHFEAIAKVIRDLRQHLPGNDGLLNLLSYKLADIYRDDNPHFDTTRFFAACNAKERTPYDEQDI